MYDAKNEPHEFVAETREEAIAKASRFFGVDAEALICSELPAGEVYGLGGRAVVVAALKDRTPPAPRGVGPRGEGGGFRERERGRERDREAGGRGRGRDRERGGRGDRGDRGRDRGGRGEGSRRAERPVLSDEPSVGTP